jgi:hypothetical protein
MFAAPPQRETDDQCHDSRDAYGWDELPEDIRGAAKKMGTTRRSGLVMMSHRIVTSGGRMCQGTTGCGSQAGIQ